MKKPKFKFELKIGTSVSLYRGYRYNDSGDRVQDDSYTSTAYITRPGFTLPEAFYGHNVRIVYFNDMEGAIFSHIVDYNTFGPIDNSPINFTYGAQFVAVSVKHKMLSTEEPLFVDADNIAHYLYLVHPDFSKLSKETSRESDEMYMRSKLTGSLKFKNGAFDCIANLNMNNSISLRISKFDYDTNSYIPYYQTVRFTKLDCTFDYDRRLVTPNKLDPDDQYSLILSGMDIKYDLIKAQTRRSKLSYKIPPLKQLYIYGSKQVTNIIGESYFVDDGITFPDIPAGQFYELVLAQYHFTRTAFFREVHALLQDPDYPTGARINVAFHNESSFTYGQVLPFPQGLMPGSYAFGPTNFRWKLHFNNTSYRLELQEYDTGVVYARSEILPVQSMLGLAAGINLYKVSDNTWCGLIDNVFDYDVYQRTLFYKHPADQTPNEFQLAADDFAYSGGVYNRAEVAFDNRIHCRCSSDTALTPGELGLLQGVNGYYTNAGLSHGDSDIRIMPVCTDTWSGISIWADGSIYYANLVNRFGYDFQNLCAFSVVDAIKAIAKKIAPRVVISENMQSSEFLYGFYNPIGLARVYPIITPLSNIQAGAYMRSAQKAEVSMRELLDLLKNAMQLYWYIDDSNVMHIEHKKWFLNAGTYEQKIPAVDTTTINDIWNNKVLDTGHGELKYDSSSLFKHFTLTAEEDATDCSKATDITVEDNSLATLQSQDINLGEFKVNLDYLFATGSADIREDGFVFILAESSENEAETALFGPRLYTIPRIRFTDETFKCDCGKQYSIQPLNTYAMPHYLIKYYMWDFPGAILNPNLGLVMAKTRLRSQQIRIPLERDLDKYSWIQTRFGKGLVNSINVDFDTQYATIELLHSGDTEFAWPFSPNLPATRTLIYDKRLLLDDMVIEGDYFYILPSTGLYDGFYLMQNTRGPLKLLELLSRHTNGIRIECSFKIDSTSIPASPGKWIFTGIRYPLDSLATNYRCLGIGVFNDSGTAVFSAGPVRITAGSIRAGNTGATISIPSSVFSSNVLYTVSIDIISVGNNIQFSTTIEASTGQRSTVDASIAKSAYREYSNGLCLNTAARGCDYSYPDLRFKDFKIFAR